MTEKISKDQVNLYSPKWRQLLYQIEVEDDEGDATTWDGTVNVLRRATQRTVEKNSQLLMSRIEKLQHDI